MTFQYFVKKSNDLGYSIEEVHQNFGDYNYDNTEILDSNGKRVAYVLDGYFGSYHLCTPAPSLAECNLISKYAFTKAGNRKQPM